MRGGSACGGYLSAGRVARPQTRAPAPRSLRHYRLDETLPTWYLPSETPGTH